MEDEVLNLILPIENKLKAALRLLPTNQPDTWVLDVRLYYEGQPAGRTSFTLHHHTREEAEEVARNLRHHEGIMQEIELLLWTEENE